MHFSQDARETLKINNVIYILSAILKFQFDKHYLKIKPLNLSDKKARVTDQFQYHKVGRR